MVVAEAWESAAAGGLATRVRWPWWEDDDSSDQKKCWEMDLGMKWEKQQDHYLGTATNLPAIWR